MHVTTGCGELDAILGGGIESGSITELYGEFRTGKSQLCLTVAVSSFLPRDLGGGEGRTMYLDTEGSFRPERLAHISERFELDVEFVTEHIVYARIHNCDQLDKALLDAAALFADESGPGPFRTLILDSIIGVCVAPRPTFERQRDASLFDHACPVPRRYRQEFVGRAELAERQQRIGQVTKALKRLAEQFNLAVLYTNQVTADPGAMAMQDAKKAVGGNIIAHASDTRVYLRKGKGEQRVAKIVDSPMMPEAEAIFQLHRGGITDATD